MGKKSLLILFVLGLTADIFSQSTQKWNLSIDQGLSVPVGQFGSKKYSVRQVPESKLNGLAKTGLQFNVSAGYSINRTITVQAQIGYSYNEQDKTSYENYFSKSLITPFTVAVKTRTWKIFKTLLGVKFQQEIGNSKNFFAEEKLMAGISKTKEPGFEIMVVSGSGLQQQVFQQKQSDTDIPLSFAYQFNIGLGYNINKQIFLLLDAGYFDSKPVYKFVYTPPPFSSQSPFDSKFIYKLSSVGLTASIGVRL